MVRQKNQQSCCRRVTLDVLIFEGVNITRQAQEGNALYSDNQFLAEDVHNCFALWRIRVRKFVSEHYPNVASFFFEADSVPDLIGGFEYGNVASEKSQTLLRNIREETAKKLEHLKELPTRHGEILKLSPEFYGFGINLRVLWHKVRKFLD